MTLQRIPNTQVWLLGREYLEAAEILLDYNRLWPAALLAALALEIFLKSFLAARDHKGNSKTDRGHSLTELFGRISTEDQKDILNCSKEFDASVDFVSCLGKFDNTFFAARYRYEAQAARSVGSDIIYFARHVCESIFLLGKRRGV